MEKKKKEEKVLSVLKTARRSFLIEYSCGFFLLGLLVVFSYQGTYLNRWISYFVFGLALFSFASAEISRLVHRCEVTSSKIVIRNGLIRQSKKHVYLEAISDIDVKQGIIQRLLDYGIIHIKSMSGEGALEIWNVANPEAEMEKIEEIIEKYKNN